MATSYNSVIRNAALRVNAIAGTTSVALEAAYTTTPLTATQVDSADFSLSGLKDTCLLVEEQLANAIANTGNHPWRRLLQSETADIAHEAAIPSTDASSNQIIGIYGAVYDSSDGSACSEMAMDDIRIAVRNANSWAVSPVYGFKIDGGRIFHTRTSVKIDVCTYNRTARQTAIDTLTTAMLLPDALEEAIVCGMVSLLIRDDAFMQQAQVYRGYFADSLNSISQGLTSVASKSVPAPTLAAA